MSSHMHRIVRWLAPASLLCYIAVSVGFTTLVIKAGFHSLLEVGYGDSYILYDILNFEKTGAIYRSWLQPPYFPAQYSPMVYLTYALSGLFPAFSPTLNPFAGPRVIALLAFLACVCMTAAITKQLMPAGYAWLWALGLAASIRNFDLWILQIRGDFPGIFFGLAAIRFLLSQRRYSALFAGLCAGLAIQMKLTLVTAAVSGVVWLVMKKRLREAAVFVAGVAVTSVGFYFAYWLREPNMLHDMTVLLPGIKDVPGAFVFLGRALQEPVLVLSLPAIPILLRHVWKKPGEWPDSTLVVIYASLAALLGFATSIQAGANINYYFEALLAITPFAALGLLRLFRWSGHHSGLGLFLAGLFVLQFVVTDGKPLLRRQQQEFSAAVIQERNSQFAGLEDALRGKRILSIDPRVALIDPQPILTEPFLLSYLRREGRFDPTELLKRISEVEFDVFVSIPVEQGEWRGLHRFEGKDLAEAVSNNYSAYCQLGKDIIELPRAKPHDLELENKLRASGCLVYR